MSTLTKQTKKLQYTEKADKKQLFDAQVQKKEELC